jgi:hypothetical protein
MRAAIVACMLTLPFAALAQTGSSSGTTSGGSAPSASPSTTQTPSSPAAPVPTAPIRSQVDTPPVAPSSPPVVPDPSIQTGPTPDTAQPPPLPSGPVRTSPAQGAPATRGATRDRAAAPPEETEQERERERREARLRQSEERIRRLIRDICTGCEGPRATGTRSRVVRAKG